MSASVLPSGAFLSRTVDLALAYQPPLLMSPVGGFFMDRDFHKMLGHRLLVSLPCSVMGREGGLVSTS